MHDFLCFFLFFLFFIFYLFFFFLHCLLSHFWSISKGGGHKFSRFACLSWSYKDTGFSAENLLWSYRETKEAGYKTLVLPKLEYVAPVWNPYAQAKN